MHTRLLELIQYKTGGKQTEFAAIMGWSPQYLFRMLKGVGGIGIRPVVALLEKFPELNARWLLLGEGAMISSGADAARQHLFRLLALEKYMPVMTPEELRLLTDGKTEWPEETLARWARLLDERTKEIDDRFSAAYKRQD